MATPDEDDALRRRIELSIEHVVVLIDRCDWIPPANVNYEIKMSLQSSLEFYKVGQTIGQIERTERKDTGNDSSYAADWWKQSRTEDHWFRSKTS